ncbi:MAG: DUF2706 domain-containing protein [Rickettsiaceae bacterium]|nr:DUF2706 domain-containing protein [Rickettsiaceae bacterium]
MNYLVLLISAVIMTSCTAGTPYEVKSPCVAIDTGSEDIILMPCVRRPANLDHYIV